MKGRFYIFFPVTLLILLSFCSIGTAQFYVSPKACVGDAPTITPPMGNAAAASTSCSEPTSFFDTDTTSKSWLWNFGDGNIANTRNPKNAYLAAGNYTVTLIKNSIARSNTVTKNITVGSYPNQPKFNNKIDTDTTVCDGSKLTLNPFKLTLAGDYDYRWFPKGETTKTIEVDTSGCYSVEVIDKITGCSRTARIKVTFCLQESSQGGGNENWYFGDRAVLDFALTGTPTVRDTLAKQGETTFIPEIIDPAFDPAISSKTHTLKTDQATAMVYGPTGALVFYSDGKKLYSGTDDTEILKADGSSFVGSAGLSSQSVLIIPKTGCIECAHQQYYLYTIDSTTKTLSYSVIDMRYNNKKGAITETNIPLYYPVNGRMVATRKADDSGFVIYTHENNSSVFNIITVDSTGTTSISQPTGTAFNASNLSTGVMAIAPNGRRLAQGVVIGGQNYIEVYDIDPTDYTLQNRILINLNSPAPPNVYGVTFSQNSDLLYVTTNGNPSKGEESKLMQLALFLGNAATISSNIEIISRSTTESFAGVQLGPVFGSGSKYVYVSIVGRSNVPYIQNPDVKGNAAIVGYTDFPGSANPGAKLNGVAKLGFPNITQAAQEQDGESLGATYDGNCFNSPTVLSTQGVCSPLRNEVTWVFPDGSTQTGTSVSYTFPKVGWNKFTMKVKIFNKSPLEGIIKSKEIIKLLETECETKILEGSIYILPAPVLTLPEKLYLCIIEGEKKLIGPAPKGGKVFTYNWQTSLGVTISTDSAYNFQAPAPYKIQVKNEFDCPVLANINVFEGCEPRLFIPEAFTPNQDGKNDTFTFKYAHLIDFNLSVYNRWGELVFETSDPEIRWDGSFKGKTFGNQMYPYVIKYRSKYFPERGTVAVRGAIMVLN